MDFDPSSAYVALGGTIVGALAAFFPAYWLERLKSKRDARVVTDSIVAEISVSLLLFERRRYLESLRAILDDFEAGRRTTCRFRVGVPDDICRIYRSHIDRIGLIPGAIRIDVVRFHQLLEAAIADVRPGGMIAEEDCGPEAFAELYEIACEIKLTGERIVAVSGRPGNPWGVS